MINQYIETNITKKVLLAETIYAHPNATIKELADFIDIPYYLIQRIIHDFKASSTLNLQDHNGHFKIDHIQSIIDFNSELYQQSPFLNYLYFVLNNTDENISVVNLSFILNRSTSSLYETRKTIQAALSEFDLKLYKNTVQGSELAHRMLIALLNYKYNLHQTTISNNYEQLITGNSFINHLINKHLHIHTDKNVQLTFYHYLLQIGIQRQSSQENLAELQPVQAFVNTSLGQQVIQLVDEWTASLPNINHLSQQSYYYFIYITLVAAPIQITDELYKIITTIHPYQALDHAFHNPSPLKQTLTPHTIQHLISNLFIQTFLKRDAFNSDSQVDLYKSGTTKLHPVVHAWSNALLTRTFQRPLSNYFINDFGIQLQNLMYAQFNFKLGIIAMDLNPAFTDGINFRLTSHWQASFTLINTSVIHDFSRYLAQFDGLIVLAQTQSYVLVREFCPQINNPNLRLIPVTNQSLLDLPITIFNLSSQLKQAHFQQWLDHFNPSNN